VNTHDSLSDRDAGPAPQSSKPVPERAMNDGKSKENFRARRLSLADTDPAELAKAAANMNVTPDKAGGSAAPARMRQRRMSQSPEMGQKPKEIMPFPTDLVGTYSCHGVEPGHRVGEAQAKINQDRGCVVSPFAEPDDGSYRQALFCVYDGHGAQGDKASHFTMMKVQELLEKHLAEGKSEEDALKLSFTETDGLLKKDRSIDAELSGTTAVVMLFRKTGEKTEAWLAWVGDSRAIVAKPSGTSYVAPSFASNFNLTEDQKPDTPAEMARIKKAGGLRLASRGGVGRPRPRVAGRRDDATRAGDGALHRRSPRQDGRSDGGARGEKVRHLGRGGRLHRARVRRRVGVHRIKKRRRSRRQIHRHRRSRHDRCHEAHRNGCRQVASGGRRLPRRHHRDLHRAEPHAL